MGKSVNALFILAVIVLLPSAFAEIIVNTGDPELEPGIPGHSFQVNMYITSYLPSQPSGKSIIIEPLVTEAAVDECQTANLSFKLSNYGSRDASYRFGTEKFTGTAYLSPSVIIPSKGSRIIHFALSPCGKSGDLNPLLKVETEDEIAYLPVLLHVNEGTKILETECRFYYSEEICSSPFYIRFYQDRKYLLDLSDWFYDPDEDILSYDAESTEIDVKIKGETAELTSRRGFSGASEVLFTAKDESGGSAQKRFFFHVLEARQDQIPWLLVIGIAIIILLLLLILLATLLRKN